MTTPAISLHETAHPKPKPMPWRRPKRERELPVVVGNARRIVQLADLASAPTLVRTMLSDGVEIEVRAPGASAKNTQVFWDPARERLVVGVWAPKAPDGHRGRSELTYYKPIRAPGYDGARATVRVRRGVITLFLPLAR